MIPSEGVARFGVSWNNVDVDVWNRHSCLSTIILYQVVGDGTCCFHDRSAYLWDGSSKFGSSISAQLVYSLNRLFRYEQRMPLDAGLISRKAITLSFS